MITVVKKPVWMDWYPVDFGSGGTSTAIVGSIVELAGLANSHQGVKTMGASAANPNTAKFPFGVIMGINDQLPTYSSTYMQDSAASVGTQATELARKWTGQEGSTSKREPALMAQVAIIDRTTISVLL